MSAAPPNTLGSSWTNEPLVFMVCQSRGWSRCSGTRAAHPLSPFPTSAPGTLLSQHSAWRGQGEVGARLGAHAQPLCLSPAAHRPHQRQVPHPGGGQGAPERAGRPGLLLPGRLVVAHGVGDLQHPWVQAEHCCDQRGSVPGGPVCVPKGSLGNASSGRSLPESPPISYKAGAPLQTSPPHCQAAGWALPT